MKIFLYQMYQDKFEVTVIRTAERLSAAVCNVRQGKLLEIDAGSPVLRINRVAYSFNNQPVELRLSFANTDRCEYVPG